MSPTNLYFNLSIDFTTMIITSNSFPLRDWNQNLWYNLDFILLTLDLNLVEIKFHSYEEYLNSYLYISYYLLTIIPFCC